MIPTHRLYISLAIKPAFHLAQNEVVAFLRVSAISTSPLNNEKPPRPPTVLPKKNLKKKKALHWSLTSNDGTVENRTRDHAPIFTFGLLPKIGQLLLFPVPEIYSLPFRPYTKPLGCLVL